MLPAFQRSGMRNLPLSLKKMDWRLLMNLPSVFLYIKRKKWSRDLRQGIYKSRDNRGIRCMKDLYCVVISRR